MSSLGKIFNLKMSLRFYFYKIEKLRNYYGKEESSKEESKEGKERKEEINLQKHRT